MISGAEGDAGRFGGAGQVDEELDGVDDLLGGGAEHGHHPALGLCSPVGAVGAADLAGDGGGPHAVLGSPAGGVDGRVGQEGEQGGPVVVAVVG